MIIRNYPQNLFLEPKEWISRKNRFIPVWNFFLNFVQGP